MNPLNDVIRRVQHDLTQAAIDSPVAEAAILVAHVLEVSRGKLGVMQALGATIDDAALHRIDGLVQRRITRTPLQYLTGETGFYGLDITVEPGVFIPRPETEVLVETTLEHFAAVDRELMILDLCTGTGAIAAALADQFAQRSVNTRIWAVDLNPAAVKLAAHNTRDYNVTTLCADATDHATVVAAAPELSQFLGTFDAVVTNPPYIPTRTPVTQQEAEYDPDLALYGGSEDGADIPLQIAAQVTRWLAPGGFFIMEHDHSHAQALAAALTQTRLWDDVTTLRDLTGTDRFVSAVRAAELQSSPNSH